MFIPILSWILQFSCSCIVCFNALVSNVLGYEPREYSFKYVYYSNNAICTCIQLSHTEVVFNLAQPYRHTESLYCTIFLEAVIMCSFYVMN